MLRKKITFNVGQETQFVYILTLRTKEEFIHKPIQSEPQKKRVSRKDNEKEPSMNIRTSKIPQYSTLSLNMEFNLLISKRQKLKLCIVI